jgi:hypothetical protein
MAKGLRWAKIAEAAAGLSHADLVKAAETAAKDVLMRGDSRVTAADLVVALAERKAASVA